jgi:hypothetical protein
MLDDQFRLVRFVRSSGSGAVRSKNDIYAGQCAKPAHPDPHSEGVNDPESRSSWRSANAIRALFSWRALLIAGPTGSTIREWLDRRLGPTVGAWSAVPSGACRQSSIVTSVPARGVILELSPLNGSALWRASLSHAARVQPRREGQCTARRIEHTAGSLGHEPRNGAVLVVKSA